jgi:hypothetical protein
MPDAAYYNRQSQVLRSAASKATDPAVRSRLRSLAADYQALAALMNAPEVEDFNPVAGLAELAEQERP